MTKRLQWMAKKMGVRIASMLNISCPLLHFCTPLHAARNCSWDHSQGLRVLPLGPARFPSWRNFVHR